MCLYNLKKNYVCMRVIYIYIYIRNLCKNIINISFFKGGGEKKKNLCMYI